MDEYPDMSPRRLQFSLSTLLFVVAACALLFASCRMGPWTALYAVTLAFGSTVAVVIAWVRRETPVANAILFTYIVVILAILVVSSLVGV